MQHAGVPRRGPAPASLGLALLAALVAAGPSAGSGYEQARESAVRRCDAIDPAEYQTGLFFNPEGYRSYYVRSQCLQRVAVEFRDEVLCARVLRRRAWFSSSWGISQAQCAKLVRSGIAADEETLGAQRRSHRRGRIRLVDFEVLRDGNGRDYDIVPSFAGDPPHAYRLRFDLIPGGAGGGAVTIHSGGYHLERDSRIRIFVRREEIRARLPDFEPGQLHAVRATLIFEVGNGVQGGRWSDAFIERVFPERERTQSLEREVRF